MKWLIIITILGTVGSDYTEEDAVRFAKEVDRKSNDLFTTVMYKRWDYDTSLSDEADKANVAAQEAYDKYQDAIGAEVVKFPVETFQNPLLKRLFSFLPGPEETPLIVEKRARLTEVLNEMIDIYGTTKIKEYGAGTNATLYLDDIAKKFETESGDACKMAYYWDGWHTTVSTAVKNLFVEDINLLKEIATLNNVTDLAASWQYAFETDDFENLMAKLMDQIRPLFQQLHAYIRRQLWLSFDKNSDIIDPTGAIPASLLGNIWGLDGINIYDKTAPYRDLPSPDPTSQLVSQGYTGEKMAKTAEQFYLSINMSAMVEPFWKYSIFEKPTDREISCTDLSYDFYNGIDYRFKMCMRPTKDYFGRVHYQMGLIENYMAWKDLPFFFQDAPNPGFSSVVGDLMYLFSTNPSYLKQLGLLDKDFELNEKQDINVLYQQALATVFFLPYAYNLDRWRWKVLRGEIPPEKSNCEYWRLRLEDQGVEPPVDRDESTVDATAKYHILTNFQYITYFVSGILEFQLYKSLCIAAEEYNPKDPNGKPLHLCNIYNSKAAGNKLLEIMKLGRSSPWPDVLEAITGQRELSAEPLLEFFKPLYNWLETENKKTNEKIGWNIINRCFDKLVPKSSNEDKCRYNSSVYTN